MAPGRAERHCIGARLAIIATPLAAAVAVAISCRESRDPRTTAPAIVLRVGVAQLSAMNPNTGLRQLNQNLALEGLARPGEDGRMQPWLADGWTSRSDGRSFVVKLRPNVTFHDGSPVDATAVAALLPNALRPYMGSVFDMDVERVRALDTGSVEVAFHGASPLLLEFLEAVLQKPGNAVGTGPFMVAKNPANEMRANRGYYLGPAAIDTIRVENYPSVRTAWAEMLRDRLDMLYEVGSDALDSLGNSNTISVFTFPRRFQYVVVLNREAPALRSPAVRRALSKAIDRPALVRNALNTYGIPSSGPLWPRYWALPAKPPTFEFDPKAAAGAFDGDGRGGRRGPAMRFTCLVPPDAVNERIALEIKRQLDAIGVDMAVEEVSQDQIFQRTTQKNYEAALIEFISGPSLFRPYLVWDSRSPFNSGGWGNATIDAAFDGVHHAASETDYRGAVAGLQQAFLDDPPAIFLAWSVRARAVSKRFDVHAEPGRDVLSTLRFWKPIGDERHATRN